MKRGFGCQVSGVGPIRVTGVGCSGDGRRGRRGSGKVQTCKRAKVEGIRGRVDKWDGGQGEARDSAKVQIATGSLCKSEKVEAGDGRGERQEAVQR